MGLPAISLLDPDNEDLIRRARATQPQPGVPAVSFINASGTERDPNSLDYKLSVGATSQPDLEKLKRDAQQRFAGPAPDLTTPAVSLTGAQAQPQQTTGPTTPAISFAKRYEDLLSQEPTRSQFPAQKMPVWKKVLGGLASVAAGVKDLNEAGATARNFFGSPERKAEEQFGRAHESWERNLANAVRGANLQHSEMEDKNLQSEIDSRNRQKTEKPENLDREAYDYYVSKGLSPADARKQVLQDAQSVKPDRQTHTSPFEAFTYGDESEKKAAQDFLEMEKRLGSRYRTPSEFEEKYRLFKQDPETYRAMFGDKNSTPPDRNTATRMLNYFDKRRKEVNQDFTLDDAQKKEQLDEIEKLERPFMDAVQPGAGSRGAGSDRVEVIHPDGRHGSVPRSQLDAAKKKGYREASPN